MTKGKMTTNAGIAISILGLIFMVVMSIRSDNFNYIIGGLVVVSIGSLFSAYGKKQSKEN